MSFGLSIVATRVGAVPEIVDNAGIIVDPADPQKLYEALLTLAKNPSRRKVMSRNGRNRISKIYNWDVITRNWVQLYLSLINSK